MENPTKRELVVWLRQCAETYAIHEIWAQMLNHAADEIEKSDVISN